MGNEVNLIYTKAYFSPCLFVALSLVLPASLHVSSCKDVIRLGYFRKEL
jgi:hypothetical protein